MSGPCILLVEDDPTSLRLLQHYLAQGGYTHLRTAQSGEEALQVAEEEAPALALMDIRLSGNLDGVQTAHALSERHHTPVVYLTGSSDEGTLERVKGTAPVGYLLKPFTRKELLITVEMGLAQHEVRCRLAESERRLSVTLGNLSEGVLTLDAQGRATYANACAARLLGHEPHEVCGRDIDELLDLRLLHGHELGRASTLLFGLDEPPDPEQAFRLRGRDGSEAVVQLQLRNLPGNSADRTVLVLRDITAVLEAEERIAHMAKALSSLHDGVIVTEAGPEGLLSPVTYVNEGFRRLLGCERDEPVYLARACGEEDRSLLRGCTAKVREEGHTATFELTLPGGPGGSEARTEWCVSPVCGSTGGITHLVAVVRDLTEVRHLQSNLRQKHKVETVGRLTASVAHDFNNVLSIIQSYTDVLAAHLPAGAAPQRYVTAIREAGARAAELVGQLMRFSRRQDGGEASVDLGDALRGIVPMIERLMREDIRLDCTIPEVPCRVKSERSQFEQMVLNLCANARDAMPEGGALTVVLSSGPLATPQQVATGLNGGTYACLAVEDTGTGMDEATRKKIFEPFFTTKGEGKGTGLGLSTVRQNLERACGGLRVQSEPGKGTRFELFWPLEESAPEEEVPADEISTGETGATGSETILVVEDDETFADCIAGLLRMQGYEVLLSGDGREALRRYEARASEIALLLTDIVLPGISGREVAARFLEKNSALKILFMTGYDDEIDTYQSFPQDAQLLQKPFSLVRALSTIRERLDSSTPPARKEKKEPTGSQPETISSDTKSA